MTPDDAKAWLAELFAGAPVADAWLAAAVAKWRVPDATGLPPSSPHYTPTVDQWLAAAAIADQLHVQTSITATGSGDAGPIKSFTSEGASFTFAEGQRLSWAAIADLMRRRSPHWPGSGFGVLRVRTTPGRGRRC